MWEQHEKDEQEARQAQSYLEEEHEEGEVPSSASLSSAYSHCRRPLLSEPHKQVMGGNLSREEDDDQNSFMAMGRARIEESEDENEADPDERGEEEPTPGAQMQTERKMTQWGRMPIWYRGKFFPHWKV